MKSTLAIVITLMFAILSAQPAWADGPVNINTATAEEIASSLSGIGLSKAEKIVEYRQANGQFEHIDELVNVKGLGIKTVDKNRDLIVLGVPKSGKEG
jgi:competence protein ComEA